MRSVNLILDEAVPLARWKEPLVAVFPRVWLNHSEHLARREGLPEGAANELTVEDGAPHLSIIERPTTIHEYDAVELEALRRIVGEAKQFFAVDYTDERLLCRVLAVLLQHEKGRRLILEDEQGSFVLLEDFLAAKRKRA